MDNRRQSAKNTDTAVGGRRSTSGSTSFRGVSQRGSHIVEHSRQQPRHSPLLSSSSLASSRDHGRRSHEERVVARATHQEVHGAGESEDEDVDSQDEVAEEYQAEVALVARVVASLVLKWKEHAYHAAAATNAYPFSSSERGTVSSTTSSVVPSTGWIRHLSAWEATGRRSRPHSNGDHRMYTPLPVDVLEGLVDSAGVVLQGMENIDRARQDQNQRIEELEAELRATVKANKRLRARLGTDSGHPQECDAKTSEKAPVRVDPVLAQMIADATRATLRDHFKSGSGRTSSHNNSRLPPPHPRQHSPKDPHNSPLRAAVALPADRKPPLGGAVPILVPTAAIPPPPYAPSAAATQVVSSSPAPHAPATTMTATATSPERDGVDTAPAVLYTPPSVLRRVSHADDGSPTIVSPLTEVYSLSDPQSTSRKPSRSRSPKSSAKKAEAAEAAAAAAQAQRERDAQLDQLRDAYEDEKHAVEDALRRLHAVSSTVDVLRAQLALADDQRDLEVEEVRLCVLAQQELFDEEEAARWALVLDCVALRQLDLQAATRALVQLVKADAQKPSSASPPPLPSPSSPSSSELLTMTSAVAGARGGAKRIHFVPAPAAHAKTSPPHAAVLFARAKPVTVAAPPDNASVVRETTVPSSASSLSSVSEHDVRLPQAETMEAAQGPAHGPAAAVKSIPDVSSGLPARRLPVRTPTKMLPARTAVSPSPVQHTSPILRRSTQPPQQVRSPPAARAPVQPADDVEVRSTETSGRDHHSLALPPAPHMLNHANRFSPSRHDPAPLTQPASSVGLISPPRDVQTADESLLEWTPASLHKKDPAVIDDALSELSWQRAKQAALIDSLRRQSVSRRQSLAEGDTDRQRDGECIRIAERLSPSSSPPWTETAGDGGGGDGRGPRRDSGPGQRLVLSPSPREARPQPVCLSPPHLASSKTERVSAPGPLQKGTARPLLTTLDAEAGAPPHGAVGGTDVGAGARTSPPAGSSAGHHANDNDDKMNISHDGSGAPSEGSLTSSTHTSPNTRARGRSEADAAARKVSPVPPTHSISPPAERTPKSISRFYAQPTEATLVAIQQDGQIDRSASRSADQNEASPPPRAPPTATLLSASALLAAQPSRAAATQKNTYAPRFELPGLGCVLEATIPSSSVELRVADVREGSPANQVGVKKGDKAVPLP